MEQLFSKYSILNTFPITVSTCLTLQEDCWLLHQLIMLYRILHVNLMHFEYIQNTGRTQRGSRQHALAFLSLSVVSWLHHSLSYQVPNVEMVPADTSIAYVIRFLTCNQPRFYISESSSRRNLNPFPTDRKSHPRHQGLSDRHMFSFLRSNVLFDEVLCVGISLRPYEIL